MFGRLFAFGADSATEIHPGESGIRRGRFSFRRPSILSALAPSVGMRFCLSILLLGSLWAEGAAPAQAQDDLQVGLTFGVNRVTMQSAAETDGYFAFNGGLILRRHLGGPLSVQSELLLNQRGVRINGERGGAIDYGAGYLESPVLVHLEAPPIQSVVLHGEAGGFGAVKVFERQTPGSGDLNAGIRTGVSFYQRLNAGAVLGGGATIPFGEQRLNVTVRRTWGLRDVTQDVESQPFPEAPFPSDGETRTWALLLRLGF